MVINSFYFINLYSYHFPSIPNYMVLPIIVLYVYLFTSLVIQADNKTNIQDTVPNMTQGRGLMGLVIGIVSIL